MKQHSNIEVGVKGGSNKEKLNKGTNIVNWEQNRGMIGAKPSSSTAVNGFLFKQQ